MFDFLKNLASSFEREIPQEELDLVAQSNPERIRPHHIRYLKTYALHSVARTDLEISLHAVAELRQRGEYMMIPTKLFQSSDLNHLEIAHLVDVLRERRDLAYSAALVMLRRGNTHDIADGAYSDLQFVLEYVPQLRDKALALIFKDPPQMNDFHWAREYCTSPQHRAFIDKAELYWKDQKNNRGM